MRATTCHRCRARVYCGPDAEVGAFAATVDVTALTVVGEALAVLDGRATYVVDAPSRRQSRRISRREAHEIGRPDPLSGTLHAAHVCQRPIPDGWAAPAVAEIPTPTPTDGEPEW